MIQKNDFVEIDYTAKRKDDGFVFDTTDAKVAKENGLEDHGTFGPIIIAVGHNQIIGGLDKNLIGKDAGKEYTIVLNPEEAFGKKSAKLVQLISSRKFVEQKIMPQPGLQVNIDGMTGIIKTVSGGRTLVDFNHPLAGRTVEYKVKINRKVEDDKEKLASYLKVSLGLKNEKVELTDGKAKIELPVEIQKPIKEELSKQIREAIPGIKEIDFVKQEKKPAEKKAKESTTQ